MISRFVSVAALGLLGVLSAAASTILVNNLSFEILPVGGLPFGGCGTGCLYSTAAVPGWSGVSATSGQFQPGTQLGDFAYFSTLSAGNTSAYTNGQTLSQTVLSTTVVPGHTYTLLVDLGRRNDTGFATFHAAADLLIGGLTVIPAIGTIPNLGNWSTYTASFLALPGDAGKTITIQLTSSGRQGNFDNVRLDDLAGASVPEPAGVTLLGLGLAGLLVFARRRRAV
jgi:hypothetical protein